MAKVQQTFGEQRNRAKLVDLSSLQGKLEKSYRKDMECELPALIDPDIPPIDEISY